MNDKSISTNAADVYDKFIELNFKEMGKALKNGLRKALRGIQKKAKTNLSSSFRNTNKVNPKYSDTLQKNVRTTRIYVNDDGTVVGKVRIDSNNKKGSGSFRLPILERGNFRTKPRYAKTYNGKDLKKKRKTGNIVGKHFFKNAVDSSKADFQQNLINEVNNAIDKINKTKNG